MEFIFNNFLTFNKANIKLHPLTIFIEENNTDTSHLIKSLYEFFYLYKDIYSLNKNNKNIIYNYTIDGKEFKEFILESNLSSMLSDNKNLLKETISKWKDYLSDSLNVDQDMLKNLNLIVKTNLINFPFKEITILTCERGSSITFNTPINLGTSKLYREVTSGKFSLEENNISSISESINNNINMVNSFERLQNKTSDLLKKYKYLKNNFNFIIIHMDS